MKITLCLLTFDGMEGCRLDVPRLPLDCFAEVYAVDGGSTDGTIEYLEEQQIPVYIQPTSGLNAACVYAFSLCTTDALVFYHPKGTIPPHHVLEFSKLFDKGYSFIVGSRVIRGGRNEEDIHLFKPRKWLLLGLSLLAAVLWQREGNIVWDTLHGFRGVTVDAFRKMKIADYGLSVDIEMVIRSYKLRLPRIEFPTQECPRPYGKTHFKMMPTGTKLLKFLVKERFHPPELSLRDVQK